MQGNGLWTDLVSDWLKYTDTTVTTDIHRLWSGISMVAGAMGRRIWTRAVGGKRTYPNLYVMLVGPPGTGKGIIEEVKSMWTETMDPTGGSAFVVGSDSMTRASMIDELSKAKSVTMTKEGPPLIHHSLLIASEEFQVLLPTYDPNTVSVLNALWNNRDHHSETRRHGPSKDVKIPMPQLNIIGGMQPSYLAEHFPDATWNTGLIRRIIMVYSSEKRLQPLFIDNNGAARAKKRILERLGQLSLLHGQMKWHSEAADKINQWHLSGCPPEPGHTKLQVYNTSRTEFAVKLCMVSAISRTFDFAIELEDVDRSIAWLIEVEKSMPDIFRAMQGKSDAAVIDELHYHMMELWVKNGKKPIPLSSIVHFLSTRVPADKIQRVMQIAEGANVITRYAGTDTFYPRPRHQHGVE